MRINNDNDLRKYIPNALVTVTGEQSLFDKIRVELEISDSWFERTFGMEAYPDTVTEQMNDMACKIVASDAFLRAIPSLDLVLTPNGFGVVSNSTIAPASKERVERLVESLEISRDFAIEELQAEKTVHFDNSMQGILGLLEHKIDAYIDDGGEADLASDKIASIDGRRVKKLDVSIPLEEYGFAFQLGNTDAKAAADKVIDTKRHRGEINALSRKYTSIYMTLDLENL